MPRILSLDFGTKRVGAAVCDADGMIASPLEVYERKEQARDARHYQAIVQQHAIERIVVGLPLSTRGGEGASAARARAWGTWLAEVTGLPVVFFDERFTTVEAEELLRAAGLKASRRGNKRDMLAAQILLQDYLNAGAPVSETPGSPLADDEDAPS